MWNLTRYNKRFQPLDRAAILLMLGLSVLIGLLLWSGDHTAPRVRNFSWQDRQIGAEDVAFILTFNRPMDQASVEANLRINPPLPGKTSWAGRRMAYTLTQPTAYGTSFEIQLIGAQEQAGNKQSRQMQPFSGHFATRDRAFVYLGEGAEAGRLVFYNLTQSQKRVLTPPELVVTEFKPYLGGDTSDPFEAGEASVRVLFSATERVAQGQGGLDPKLYTVSTNLHSPAPADEVKLVLDNADYQILKFDLAPDGQAIVVQRADRRNPVQSSLWLVKPDTAPQPLNNQPGGDFLVTPDGSGLVLAQGQGLAVLPLDPQKASQPLDFLPKFGTVLSFARDGGAAAMVKFNLDYTRSLFFVTNQGLQKELLRTTGSILSAQFDPLKQTLYCLLTQLLPGPDYQERPYLAAINLQTGKLNPLVVLPIQRDVQMGLAPDGTALLFDQAASASQSDAGTSGSDPSSKLWLLPLQSANPAGPAPPKLQALPVSGSRPRWLP